MTHKWSTSQIPSQQGRTALITGANSGIGFQAALELARHGAHVLIACRTQARGESAAARIRQQAADASVEAVLLDLASLASIHSFAAAFRAAGRPLDLLVNNAGVMALPERRTTADGFELQFGTNHLGHFALTGLLLPALLAAPKPRVVTVSSIAHKKGQMNFDDLQWERSYRPWAAYNQSKLANLLFALELDRRAKTQHGKLISTPVHPGISRTSIVANGPGTADLKSKLLTLFAFAIMQSDAAGALPTLYAATDPSIRGGEYIGPDGPLEFKGSPTRVHPSLQALDVEAARRLWTISEALTGIQYPPLA